MKLIGLKLAAVLCAISLWFFVVSGKNYQLELEIPLRLENLPDKLAISSAVPPTIRVLLEGSGIDLVRLRQLDSLAFFDLNLTDAVLGTRTISLDATSFRCALKGIKLLSSSTTSLDLEMDTRISLQVPVRLGTDPQPAKDYLLLGEPTVIPNQIRISGARKLLTKVFEVVTLPVSPQDLEDSDTLDVPIALEAIPSQVHLEQHQVRVAVRVEKRTTRSFPHIPVQLVGPYQRGFHRIDPTHVDLLITGGRETLKNLRPEDIRLFLEFTRFEVEQSDSIAPTLVVDQPIENWSANPGYIHLVTENP